MFDLSDIRRLLDAYERSDWDELHFVADGYEVHISASDVAPVPGTTAGAALAGVAPAPAAAAASAHAPAPPTRGNGTGTPPAAAEATATAAADGVSMEGAHAVTSPSPGIFWRAPAPGEPPFVEVGQPVTPETPIGIVEVMKLMNQVLAGVRGTVRAVLVENGNRVERGAPMVLIDEAS